MNFCSDVASHSCRKRCCFAFEKWFEMFVGISGPLRIFLFFLPPTTSLHRHSVWAWGSSGSGDLHMARDKAPHPATQSSPGCSDRLSWVGWSQRFGLLTDGQRILVVGFRHFCSFSLHLAWLVDYDGYKTTPGTFCWNSQRWLSGWFQPVVWSCPLPLMSGIS